jgi:hypothetical protein
MVLLFYKGGAPPLQKIALTHMAINLTAVVLYAINIWLQRSRKFGHDPWLASMRVLETSVPRRRDLMPRAGRA